ncbi:MAG TPA: response regulator [Stellaceae bacterium]|nr:response regulator [Stellaceae bacterium]
MTDRFWAKVLIINGDREVRSLIADLLGEAGFAVMTTSSFWDALDIVEKQQFDLLVTDVQLPGELSGIDLVICARARWPSVKALFISGKSELALDDPDQDGSIAKPFHPTEVLGCALELMLRQRPKRNSICPRRAAAQAIVKANVEFLRRGTRAS